MASQSLRVRVTTDADLQRLDVVAAICKRRGVSVLNLDRMLLNGPAYWVGCNSFSGALRTGSSLNLQLRVGDLCSGRARRN